MRPSVFVEIDELPLSPTTGKLKLDELPPAPRRHSEGGPELNLAEGANEPARREVMRAAWARVLGLGPGDIGDDADFFDLGGHSLLAVELTGLVARVFGVEVSVQQVYEHPTVASLVRLLDGPPPPGPEHHIVARAAPLQADAHLPEEISPAGPAACRSLDEARVVFLTGATGFLGAFLLDELLRETEAEVRCLVRARDPEAARRRLEANLARYHLDSEAHASRIVPVVGDLSQERLGLSPEAFTALAGEVDLVFHCAALVHYVYPYAKLRGPTVLGTREVLRLACTGRVSPMVHVSTNGIVPEGAGLRVPETDAIDGYEAHLEHGYGQAKWVAEKLVWEAVRRGQPVCIFRPGNIGHHSATGASNPNDLQYHLLEACLKLRAAPRQPEWAVELTPVDFLVRALVRLARDPAHWGQVFHVVGHPPMKLSMISQALMELGLVTERAHPEAWAERLLREAKERGDPALEILARTLDDLGRALTHANHFERERFDEAAGAVGLEAPTTDRAYLDAFLERRAAALGELSGVASP
jgi:thioester reductase-like protein